MRHVNSLSFFSPPEIGDVIRMEDGSEVEVGQDIGDGWFALDGGKRTLKSGFDMGVFIRELLSESRKRQRVK